MAFFPEDPERRRYAIYSVIGIVLLGLLGHQLVYEPRTEGIRGMEERLVRLEAHNLAARSAADRADEDGSPDRLVSDRERLAVAEGLIPSGDELPDLLDRIAAEAAAAGVELALIRPAAVTGEGYYVRRGYDLAVLGSYHAIGDFLTRIGSLPRIVVPIDLALHPRDEPAGADTGPRLEARFAIETYTTRHGGADE